MRLNPGEIVGGKYRILRLIGDGGMGAVYEARHEVLGSMVALKFLHAELARKPGLASRFLQEAKVSASIQSPHVTHVTDVDTAQDGSPYLVMELLSGESLQQLLDRRGKLGRDLAIDIALQVLAGLEAAHALGVVHRDLKPDNVYVTASAGGPVVKLLDFGIAKLRESNEYLKGLTRPGALMGTPEYMAPEQLYAAERVDHRADLYSLGAILYEMLSGERPAYGADAPQIVSQVAAGKIKRLEEHDASLPRGLCDVVHRALSPDKQQRLSSAFEMRMALAPFAEHLSHAGRLAAAPIPGELTAGHAEAERPAPTLDGPALTASHLPAGWNPNAGPHKGGTQEVPKELMRELASGYATTAPVHPATVRYSNAAYAAPGAPPQNAPGAIGSGYGSNTGNYRYGSVARARSNRLLGALIALALGVLLTGAVVLAIALSRREGSGDASTQTPASANAPPATTIAPQDVPAESVPTAPATRGSPAPTPVPPAAEVPQPSVRHPHHVPDAGATFPEGGIVLPFPQIPLPRGFPPIPTTLPPFPSGFPQIPGLPFPPQSEPAPEPAPR